MFRVPFANLGISISRAWFYGMPLSQERTPGCNQGKERLPIGKVSVQYPVPRILFLQFKSIKRMWLATVLEDEKLLLLGH